MADAAKTVTWTPVITTGVISVVIFLFGLGYYLVTSTRHANDSGLPTFNFYEKRKIAKPHRSFPHWMGVGKGGGIFQWARDALNVGEKELLRCIGLDTYMFLRFLLLAFRATIISSIAIVILVPINATGGDSEGFIKLTLGNLPVESDRVWAAAIVWYLFVPFVLWLLLKEWKHFFPLRSDYLARGDIDTPSCYRYAVIVENIPSKYRSSLALQGYFEKLFPGHVLRAFFFQHLHTLHDLIGERMDVIKKYEIVDAKIHAYPYKPVPEIIVGGKGKLCCNRGGEKVEALPHYTEEIKRLNDVVDNERQTVLGALERVCVSPDDITPRNSLRNVAKLSKETIYRPVNTGLVIFNSLSIKQSAIQVELNGKFHNMDAFPAPDPGSIIWRNITRTLSDQEYLQAVWSAIWCAGIIFWAVIVGFVQSIANLDSVLAKFGIDDVDNEAIWYGIIAGYLPVIAFILLMYLLPKFISYSARNIIQLKSADRCDVYTFKWHQMFQFANLWLIVIGGSLFNQIDVIFDDTGALLEIIGAAIPGAAVFFINYILSEWSGLGLGLSQIVPILLDWIMNKIRPSKARPQRELDEELRSNPMEWGLDLPPMLFVFLIFLVYLPIVPLIAAFAALFFGTALVVYKYLCLHVYVQDIEGGGLIWFSLFSYMMVCLYMSCVTFIGYMGIKEAPTVSVLGIIPLILTIFAHLHINRVYVQPLLNLSMEIAREMDVNEPVVDIDSSLYYQPSLRIDGDIREPLPYRRNAVEGKTLDQTELSESVSEETERIA